MSVEHEFKEVLETNTVSRAQQIVQTRFGTAMLGLVSFTESALPLPILTDPFLVASVLLNRTKTAKLIIITTIGSVIGGLVAYFAALFFFDLILEWMTPAMLEQFEALKASNGASTFAITIAGAVTPIPYTIVAWLVGVIEGNLGMFIAASVLGRGFRYGVVGYCTYKFGPLAVAYAKRYIGIASVIVLILVALFLWHKM